MIVVLDEAAAHRELATATLACPGCSGPLRPWGFARARSLRVCGGGRISLQPRRARCTACAVTHVLLPALAPPRRAYTIDVVGQVLLAAAAGQGHRRIGAEFGLPPATVRGWIRRVTAQAEWLRAWGTTVAYEFDPELPAIIPAGSAFADALSALGLAAAAVRRFLGVIASPWQVIAALAGGRLLTPIRS